MGYVKPIALKYKINPEIPILHVVKTITNHTKEFLKSVHTGVVFLQILARA